MATSGETLWQNQVQKDGVEKETAFYTYLMDGGPYRHDAESGYVRDSCGQHCRGGLEYSRL